MSELNRLRCQLRAVNIEYSALVRGKTAEAACARLLVLRTERHGLMALIAVESQAAATERPIERTLCPAWSVLQRRLAAAM
jgi:hypothetical protein